MITCLTPRFTAEEDVLEGPFDIVVIVDEVELECEIPEKC